MKTSRLAALAAAATCAFTLVPGSVRAQDSELPLTDPLKPVGAMTAFPTIVQTGTKPTLTWNIMFPSKVGSANGGGSGNGNGNGGGAQNIAIVSPPGTIIPVEDVFVTVQIIGTGVTSCDGSTGTPPPTDLRMSVNGSSYFQLFFGTQAVVNPAHALYTKQVLKGQHINFGGRYVIGSGWSPFYTTRSSNLQVVSLVNGDPLPVSTQSTALATYIKPYLDAANKVKIGPLSVLVVMELAQTNRNSPCFDCQDQVALVTLSRKHPNHGHGNNLDGVDVSNPGQGGGGPNGRVDPSGTDDDERR
jgi:hypothetical protein